MSVCGGADGSSCEEAGGGAAVRDIYEQRAVSTVVRVLTVLAYLLSVSLAAILLSVYYICVWRPAPADAATDGRKLSAQHAHQLAPDDGTYNYVGGSNITVNNISTQLSANHSAATTSESTHSSASAEPSPTAAATADDNSTDVAATTDYMQSTYDT